MDGWEKKVQYCSTSSGMVWPQPSEYIIELLTFEEWLCCDYMNIKSNADYIYNFQHISSQGRFPFEWKYTSEASWCSYIWWERWFLSEGILLCTLLIFTFSRHITSTTRCLFQCLNWHCQFSFFRQLMHSNLLTLVFLGAQIIDIYISSSCRLYYCSGIWMSGWWCELIILMPK